MKIVVLDGYTLNPGDLSWDGFEQMGELTVYDRTPAELIIERAKDANIVITNKTPLSRDTLFRLPLVKYIGVLATGYNVVDIKAAKELSVTVTNIPTYGTDSVAQLVFALLLELCHRAGDHSRTVHNGDWVNSTDFCYWKSPLIELAGKTMGIIGYGRIGRRTAEVARAFGMNVLAYDASPLSEAEMVTLDELLAKSDVISLHCPLFEETKGIINRESLRKMKRSAFLINTSRGPLIDEEELAWALDSGRLAGAAVDVLSTEPPTADNPLLKAKNCIITPHIAWATAEARARLMGIAVENLKAYFAGEAKNVVS